MNQTETKYIPMRMCVICRERFPKASLVRINEGGKGKYVCSNEGCRAKAAKRFAKENE